MTEFSDAPLFRSEAVNAHRPQWHGRIVMSSPLAGWMAALCAGTLSISMLALIYFASYTKRVTVSGRVSPTDGVTRVYSPQSGTILEALAVDGQRVSFGDVLFVVSSDRQTIDMKDVQAAASSNASAQIEILRGQLARTRDLQLIEVSSLRSRITSLEAEHASLVRQTADQRLRMEIEEEGLSRYESLRNSAYITHDQYTQKLTSVMDQRLRLASMARDLLGIQRLLEEARSQYSTAPIKYSSQISDLERTMGDLEQRLIENEGRRRFVVTATDDGIVSSIIVNKGQRVDTTIPLASIVPDNSALTAELYAPSRAIGLLQAGASVRIAYDAFPYQKYGLHTGTIVSVSSSALSSNELTISNVFEPGALGRGGEPLYRVVVSLPSRHVDANGRQYPIRPGLVLQAHVTQDRRRLYEWALNPLYSLAKKL